MAVRVDPLLPIRPITVEEVGRMVEAGVFDEDDRCELLEGVLVEMSPQSPDHAYATRALNALAAPAAAAAGLDLLVQMPLQVGSPISLPEPDLAITPRTPRGQHPSGALLVVEIGLSSLAIDLRTKAAIYAAASVPDYWVLDVEARELVVHRQPRAGAYARVQRLTAADTVSAVAVALEVPVAALL